MCFGFVDGFVCIVGVDVLIASGVLEDIVTTIGGYKNWRSLWLCCGSCVSGVSSITVVSCCCCSWLCCLSFCRSVSFWCIDGKCFSVSSGGMLSIEYSSLFCVFFLYSLVPSVGNVVLVILEVLVYLSFRVGWCFFVLLFVCYLCLGMVFLYYWFDCLFLG